MDKKTITFDSFIRALTSIALTALAYYLLRRLSNVLMPFLIAWLIAYLLYPIVCFVQYRCKVKSRILSIIITFLAIIGILTGCMFLIIPPIIEELNQLQSIIVNYVSTDSTVSSVSAEVENFIKHNIDMRTITRTISLQDIYTFLEEKIPQFMSLLSNSLSAIIGAICSLISLIYMFFILADYEEMARGFFKLIPPSKRELMRGIMTDLNTGMNSYFRGCSTSCLTCRW